MLLLLCYMFRLQIKCYSTECTILNIRTTRMVNSQTVSIIISENATENKFFCGKVKSKRLETDSLILWYKVTPKTLFLLPNLTFHNFPVAVKSLPCW